MKTIYILIFSLTLLVGCSKDNDEQSNAESDFDTFYEKFHSDSLYQINHIQFPLAGRSAMGAQDASELKWQKKDWKIHRIFDPQETGFLSNFNKISNEFIIETIILNGGDYGMERRFSRLDDEGWYLIYYADLHPIARAQ